MQLLNPARGPVCVRGSPLPPLAIAALVPRTRGVVYPSPPSLRPPPPPLFAPLLQSPLGLDETSKGVSTRDESTIYNVTLATKLNHPRKVRGEGGGGMPRCTLLSTYGRQV